MLSNFDANNLTTFRGDDLDIDLKFMDTNGVAIDITGWTVFFTLKNTKDDPDSSALLRIDMPPASIPNPTLGQCRIKITAAQAALFTGSYWYDIQIKKLDDTIQTITNGALTFKTDTTIRTTPQQ